MREAADANGLLVITEIMDTKDIPLFIKYSDILQVGTRNMQNFSLLKELGSCGKPVMLKRGMSATIKEFLMAAEYLMAYGNSEVILCERGVRTFETATRNTFDINAVALLREKTHLPVIADPSHGTGRKSIVVPVACAAVVAGAQGVTIEIHKNPSCALSDGPQSLNFDEFTKCVKKLKIAEQAKKAMNELDK
jgi:3-deoxy-7-phosphoheptulonate synthase